MKNYKSLDTFTIKGRRTFVIENDEDREYGCKDLINKEIMIDDKKYIVERVGSFTLPTIKKGTPIDIIVKENDN